LFAAKQKCAKCNNNWRQKSAKAEIMSLLIFPETTTKETILKKKKYL